MPQKNTVGQARNTPTTRRPLPQAGPAHEEQPDEDRAAHAAGQSRADLFANAKKAEGFDFPVGQYYADLVECNLVIDGDKESVQFKYTVTEGEQNEKSVNAWFNFFDEDGQPMQGMEFFKKDIDILGEDVDEFVAAYREGREAFEDRLRVLAEERKAVVIDVKNRKGYTNVFLKGLQQS